MTKQLSPSDAFCWATPGLLIGHTGYKDEFADRLLLWPQVTRSLYEVIVRGIYAIEMLQRTAAQNQLGGRRDAIQRVL